MRYMYFIKSARAHTHTHTHTHTPYLSFVDVVVMYLNTKVCYNKSTGKSVTRLIAFPKTNMFTLPNAALPAPQLHRRRHRVTWYQVSNTVLVHNPSRHRVPVQPPTTHLDLAASQ